MHTPVVLQTPDNSTRAQIAPTLGFNCFDFTTELNDKQVVAIDAPDDFLNGDHKPSRYGIPILFPFPNRIANAKFSWAGKDYELPVNGGNGHAIHGFCLDKAWRIAEQTATSVTGEFQLSVDAPERVSLWPADFILRMKYSIGASSLRCDVSVTNPSDAGLPWGYGTHPYFRLPLTNQGAVRACGISADVTKQWVLEENIPTGEVVDDLTVDLKSGVTFDEVPHLDDVFTGFESSNETPFNCEVTDPRSQVQLIQSCGRGFRELVIFTPKERDAVCLEPYTCATNAIHLHEQGIHAGWQVLEPGGSYETWFQLDVKSV